jgi:hypothetical protein
MVRSSQPRGGHRSCRTAPLPRADPTQERSRYGAIRFEVPFARSTSHARKRGGLPARDIQQHPAAVCHRLRGADHELPRHLIETAPPLLRAQRTSTRLLPSAFRTHEKPLIRRCPAAAVSSSHVLPALPHTRSLQRSQCGVLQVDLRLTRASAGYAPPASLPSPRARTEGPRQCRRDAPDRNAAALPREAASHDASSSPVKTRASEAHSLVGLTHSQPPCPDCHPPGAS